MPDQSQSAGQQLDASYPAPPDYYAQFTDANMARLASTDIDAVLDDPELRLLVPPAPPVSGSYSGFGRLWQVQDRFPTLAEQNIPQLYSEGPIDRITELKRLNHSILFEFLDLVDVLIKDPSQFGARTERIRDILVNAHHLINEYRSHQAKETLKLMLQQQIDAKRESTRITLEKCKELEAEVERLRQEAAAVDIHTNVPEAAGHAQEQGGVTGGADASAISTAGLQAILEAVQAIH
ncbi:Mediator of RNA polymerase II transcription subunit 7 [Coemansia sp. RSA 2050]|nr:Mediator of RNA polymerase II transcription subunit 7 [Coemansia sp. RSA 2050]KAJ2730468.1 Mediator of RNA polymerase II transcription subunit 7 [Coemansia sp. BCRC 34962]